MHNLLRKFARSAKSPPPLLTTAERKGTRLTNSKSMLLLLDNYDSFTYNLAQYFGELGCELLIKRNDEISLNEITALAPDHICISPGPCTPREAGIYHSLVVERSSFPGCLEITAESDDGEIMALRHRQFPVQGVQFHPESVLTQDGKKIIESFLSRPPH